MKKLLYSISILLFLLACHKSDTTTAMAVDPIDPLYRRWQAVAVSDTYITFLAEGIILYGADGRDNSCCTRHFFVRQDSLLVLNNAPVKSIPVALKHVDCSAVSCLFSNDPWRIVTLTTDQLVLKTAYGVQTYKPG